MIKNYLAVARYCDRFPGPKGNKNPLWRITHFPYKCYHVYKWRKEIGIIHPDASIVSILKGIGSYGHWLRSRW